MTAATFWAHIGTCGLGPAPEPRPLRITMRDDSLPHQIRIFGLSGGHQIAVSCTCRSSQPGGTTYEPLEVRPRWDSSEPIQVWRRHMEAVQS